MLLILAHLLRSLNDCATNDWTHPLFQEGTMSAQQEATQKPAKRQRRSRTRNERCDERAREGAEGGARASKDRTGRKRRARDDRRDAEAGSRDGRAAPRDHQGQRAGPLAEDLVRDARVCQQDGKIVCFFQSADKFKSRYATLGFNDAANLDQGAMWPTSFALKELTAADRDEDRRTGEESGELRPSRVDACRTRAVRPPPCHEGEDARRLSLQLGAQRRRHEANDVTATQTDPSPTARPCQSSAG